MPLDSDIDDLGDWLDGVIAEIGWDMPAGPEGSTHGSNSNLGEAAIDTVIDHIQADALAKRGADAAGSDAEEWIDNERVYRRRKEGLYGEHNPNFRTNQMLSRESLKGSPEIGHEAVDWPYGTGTPSPDGKTKHDRTITDIEKARYAERGQSEHDVRRPFFAVSDAAADNVVVVVESAIEAHLQRKGQNP